MNRVLSASRLMKSGEANKLIKDSLSNKEALSLADLQAKARLNQIKDKKVQKKIASQVS